MPSVWPSLIPEGLPQSQRDQETGDACTKKLRVLAIRRTRQTLTQNTRGLTCSLTALLYATEPDYRGAFEMSVASR